MALPGLLVGRELRARWRGLMLLGLLTFVWAAALMTAIAGARRTASVVDRFERVTVATDATFGIEGDYGGVELLEALRASPEVAAADVIWSASTGLGFDRGLWLNLVVATENVWGREFALPIVVRGRQADAANASEVTITQETADYFDVDVGDRMALPTWDRDEWEAWGQLRGQYPPFNGPLLDLLVVGIVDVSYGLSAAEGDGLFVIATPALVDRWGASIGVNVSSVAVRFHKREFDATVLAQRLTETLSAPVGVTSRENAFARNLRDATGSATVGLTVLVAAVAIAGGLVIALAVARDVRRASALYEPLRALGATPRQRISVVTTPIAITCGIAAVVAVVGAGFASAVFPLGAGRVAEPDRGIWLDAPVLAGGVLVVLFLVGVAVLLQLPPMRSGARRSPKPGWRPSFLRNVGPTAMIGLVNAVGTRRARSSIVVAAVTIGGLLATAWFEQSMIDLGSKPERWGYTWSSSPEIGVPAAQAAVLVDQLVRQEGVVGVGYLDSAVVSVAGNPVTLLTFIPYRGEQFHPVVLAGRLPTATFEMAVGETTARQLGLAIGGRVLVDSAFAESHEWLVVGVVVPPYGGAASDAGVGVYTHAITFAQLDAPFSSLVRIMVVGYQSGVDRQDLETRLTGLGFRFEARSHARPPSSIANIVDVLRVVRWLFVFFLLQGLLTTMLAAARGGVGTARDRHILRILGFSRRDTQFAAAIEVATIVVIALVVGVASGLVLGRRAWDMATGDLGVVNSMRPALPIVVGIGILALVGASGVSLAISRGAVGRERLYRTRES